MYFFHDLLKNEFGDKCKFLTFYPDSGEPFFVTYSGEIGFKVCE
jgi:hypothetical protein